MLAAAIIVFREVIEAGLIVGIVLAATKGVPSRGWFVAGGISAGLIGAALLAIFAGSLSEALDGEGQKVFNAGVLALAVVMLTWHNVWMASHGKQMAAELSAAGAAVAEGAKSLTALAIVVAVAVLREGAEVVLFLYGNAIASRESGSMMLAGGMLGLGGGIALTALTYAGLVRIPPRYLFSVTSVLIALLAAGMASQCVRILQDADIVSVWADTAWNTSGFLSTNTLFGVMMQTLVGYDDRPSWLQVAAYLATLFGIFGLMRLSHIQHAKRRGAHRPNISSAERHGVRG
ncbi:iron permease FTR1 [Rhodomicrobium vannielii ATCC 17100]|uniref:Iron permease FTR1 n=1 Tax=Rhodomicrobium vannielii (strain ATCC 17100 / DSM 162 / LMG 4299 / NCIMB 10020 / ATH 3.1.1) TaxID=648757 RepID=E3I3B1_RHOVT|nr:FTR1 family protein [Rhodomicrobium vannielii]ADP71472.1 iron permease FTR1 [Rhodomicrobium vannielii ATCC 17100]